MLPANNGGRERRELVDVDVAARPVQADLPPMDGVIIECLVDPLEHINRGRRSRTSSSAYSESRTRWNSSGARMPSPKPSALVG